MGDFPLTQGWSHSVFRKKKSNWGTCKGGWMWLIIKLGLMIRDTGLAAKRWDKTCGFCISDTNRKSLWGAQLYHQILPWVTLKEGSHSDFEGLHLLTRGPGALTLCLNWRHNTQRMFWKVFNVILSTRCQLSFPDRQFSDKHIDLPWQPMLS